MSMRGCTALCIIVLGLSGGQVFSQDLHIIPETNLPSTEQIRKTGQNLAAQQRAARQELLSPEASASTEMQPALDNVTDANCINLSNIILRGVTLLSAVERTAVVKPYVKKCVGLKSVDDLTRAITKIYFDKGYIAARVYVPQQSIADGQLELQIEEGRVEALTFNGDFEVNQKGLGSLFPGIIESPVNLYTVDQGIEFINRLPSSQAKIEFVAGTQPGYTIVNLKDSSEKPIRFTIGIDNEGTKSSGIIGTNYSASFDNPVGRYDQLRLSYGFTSEQAFYFNHEPERSESYSLFYSIPYGKTLYSVSASRFSYDNWYIPDPGTPYGTSGETKSFNLEGEHTIFRDQAQILKFNAALSKTESNNFLVTYGIRVPIEVQSRSQAALSIGMNYSKLLAKGRFSSSLTYRQAIFPSGVSDDDHPSFGVYEARYKLVKANIGYSRLVSLGGKSLIYSLSFVGQQSDDNLLSAQGFAIGGKYSVRGTRQSYAAGPKGYYVQNNLVLPLNQLDFASGSRFKSGLSANIGFDHGLIKSSFDYEYATATGLSLGLKGSWNNYTVDLSAERLIAAFDRAAIADRLGMAREDLNGTRWYLKLGVNF